jgi:MFS family permease
METIAKANRYKNYLLFGSVEATWAFPMVASAYLPVYLQAGRAGFDSSAAPDILGFGLSSIAVALIITLGNILAMASQPVFGAVSDRSRNRKRLLFLDTLIIAFSLAVIPTISSLITPESNGNTIMLLPLLAIVILAWYLFSISWAGLLVLSGSIAFSFITPLLRTEMNSFIMFFGGIGNVSINLTANNTYRFNPGFPYYVCALVILLIGILYYLLVDEPGRHAESEDSGIRIRNPFGALATSLTSLDPALRKAVLLSMGIKVCGVFGTHGFGTYQSSYLLTQLNLPPSKAALAGAAFFIGYIFSTLPVGRLARKFGNKKVLRIGLLFMSFSGIAYLFIIRDFITMCICAATIGIGNGTLDVCAPPLAMSYVKDERQIGAVFSITLALTRLAGIISVPVFGFIIQITGRYRAVFPLMLAIPLIGYLLAFLLDQMDRNLTAVAGAQRG